MQSFEKLKALVNSVDLGVDVSKFDGGNTSAGRRVRKAMMDAKALAQAVRKDALPKKKDKPAEAK